MTPSEFLQAFSHIPDDQVHLLRRSPQLDGWTTDSDFYLRITMQAFPGDPDDWEARQRLVSILQEMLYTDGRTLGALLHIANTAADNPQEYANGGINALAGISCYLRVQRIADNQHLMQDFQRLAMTEELSHNARLCAKLLKDAVE